MLSKETSKLIKVAAPVVITNNILSLTQRQSSSTSKDKSSTRVKKSFLARLPFFRKIASAGLFFIAYDFLNKASSKYSKNPALLRLFTTFMLHYNLGSFSWGISIYIFVRALFHQNYKSLIGIKKFMLSHKAVFTVLLLHTRYMALEARTFAPSYCRIWLPVLGEYSRKYPDPQKRGLKRFYEHFDAEGEETSAENVSKVYAADSVRQERFYALPKEMLKTIKKQMFIFTGLYSIGFALGIRNVVNQARSLNLGWVPVGKQILKNFQELLKSALRGSLTLTFLAYNVSEFAVVYTNLVSMYNKKIYNKDVPPEEVQRNQPVQLVISSLLCLATLDIESLGRRSVLVSYLYWRVFEGLIRKYWFKVRGVDKIEGHVKEQKGLASILVSSAALLCI